MFRNPFKAFQDLVAGPARQVGTVSAVSGTKVTVTLPGGGVLQVIGEAAVSDRVFVRGGVIEGPAPTQTLVQIEV
jgi:hypothetical protein